MKKLILGLFAGFALACTAAAQPIRIEWQFTEPYFADPSQTVVCIGISGLSSNELYRLERREMPGPWVEFGQAFSGQPEPDSIVGRCFIDAAPSAMFRVKKVTP